MQHAAPARTGAGKRQAQPPSCGAVPARAHPGCKQRPSMLVWGGCTPAAAPARPPTAAPWPSWWTPCPGPCTPGQVSARCCTWLGACTAGITREQRARPWTGAPGGMASGTACSSARCCTRPAPRLPQPRAGEQGCALGVDRHLQGFQACGHLLGDGLGPALLPLGHRFQHLPQHRRRCGTCVQLQAVPLTASCARAWRGTSAGCAALAWATQTRVHPAASQAAQWARQA